MYLTTTALVLRISDYNERDAILTLLTKDHGKLTAKARGLRRKNSLLAAPCQLLAFCEVTLFEYRGMYTINEARSIELFTALRRDLIKLSLGSYFAQAAEVVSQEDVPNGDLQSLVLNCLYGLSATELPVELVKAVFEFRLACITGYMPDLSGCRVCEKPPTEFDLSAGGLLCGDCSSNRTGICLPVMPGTLDAMRYVAYCEPKKILAFRLGEKNLKEFSAIAEAYLITQLERGFPTLDFYKSLLI